LGFQYVVMVAILFYAISAIGLRRQEEEAIEGISQPAVAGESVKPGVERSGTPGRGPRPSISAGVRDSTLSPATAGYGTKPSLHSAISMNAPASSTV